MRLQSILISMPPAELLLKKKKKKKSRNSPKLALEGSWVSKALRDWSSSNYGAQKCRLDGTALQLKGNYGSWEGPRGLVKNSQTHISIYFLFLGAQGSVSSPESRRSGPSKNWAFELNQPPLGEKTKTKTKNSAFQFQRTVTFWLISIKEFIQKRPCS